MVSTHMFKSFVRTGTGRRKQLQYFGTRIPRKPPQVLEIEHYKVN